MSDKKAVSHPPNLKSVCIDLGIPFNQFFTYVLFNDSEKKHFADTDDLAALIMLSIHDKDRFDENLNDAFDAIVELSKDREYQKERFHMLEQFEGIVRRIFGVMVEFDFYEDGKLMFNCVYFQEPDTLVLLKSPVACIN